MLAYECHPEDRRVRKRLESRLAGVALPGTAGHNRAQPGSPVDQRIVSQLGVQNDPLFRDFCGIWLRITRSLRDLVEEKLPNRPQTDPGVAVQPGGCQKPQTGPDERPETGGGGWWGEPPLLYIKTPDQPPPGGVTGSSSSSNSSNS